MQDSSNKPDEVDRFIQEQIDSVPHLEALLLLWRDRSASWAIDSVAKRLWTKSDIAANILDDLAREHLISRSELHEYRYASDPEKDRLVAAVEDAYKRDTIRIANMIH